jgi:DNA-binding NarL/FixJ family response regulator
MPNPLTACVPKARVLLVDDHPLVRLGIGTLLEREPDFEVVGCADSPAQALELYAQTSPDLVVIDILLGDDDGIALVRKLRRRSPVRVLGLSVLDEPVRVAEMLRAGALGFANKTQPFGEILDAIRATLAGARYIAPSIRDAVQRLALRPGSLPFEQLTEREREVFVHLVRGESNTEVGVRLAISPRTVETHRQRIMNKLDVHSAAELVRLGTRWGVPA